MGTFRFTNTWITTDTVWIRSQDTHKNNEGHCCNSSGFGHPSSTYGKCGRSISQKTLRMSGLPNKTTSCIESASNANVAYASTSPQTKRENVKSNSKIFNCGKTWI